MLAVTYINYLRQMTQPEKGCRGKNTLLLMEILEALLQHTDID